MEKTLILNFAMNSPHRITAQLLTPFPPSTSPISKNYKISSPLSSTVLTCSTTSITQRRTYPYPIKFSKLEWIRKKKKLGRNWSEGSKIKQKIFQKTMAKESLASLKGINSHLNHFFIISTSPTMN